MMKRNTRSSCSCESSSISSSSSSSTVGATSTMATSSSSSSENSVMTPMGFAFYLNAFPSLASSYNDTSSSSYSMIGSSFRNLFVWSFQPYSSSSSSSLVSNKNLPPYCFNTLGWPSSSSTTTRRVSEEADTVHSTRLQHSRISPCSGTPSHTMAHQTLSYKLMGDVGISAIVAFFAAPWISMIDKAVVETSSSASSSNLTGTRTTIVQSCTASLRCLRTNPIQYLRSPMFLIMWSAYAATYTTANSLNTLFEHYESLSSSASSISIDTSNMDDTSTLPPTKSITTTQDMYPIENHYYQHHHSTTTESNTGRSIMLIMTTLVNTTATIFKDQYYTKTFGSRSSVSSSSSLLRGIPIPTRKVPLFTYSLWGLRDAIIIGSTFLLPDIVCDSLYSSSLNTRFIQDNEDDNTYINTKKILQVLCPMACPLIIGPIHLLSLDYYNRPTTHLLLPLASSSSMMNTPMASTSIISTITNYPIFHVWKQRWDMIRENYTSVVSARIFRVTFGFAMGGLLNTYLRDQWRDRFIVLQDEKEVEEESKIMN